MLPNVSIIILNWNGWQDTVECLESLYQIDYPNYNVIVVDNNSDNDSIEQIKKYCKGETEIKSKYFKYQSVNKPVKLMECTEESLSKIDAIYEDLPSNKKLFLIKNGKNYGFAKGNNIGTEFALTNLNPDYIFILNNDTVVDKQFLKELVNVAEADKKIGVLGPKKLKYDSFDKDVIDSIGGKINLNKYPGYFGISKNFLDKPEYFMGLSNDFINKNDYSKGILSCDWVSGSAMMIKTGLPFIYLDETYYFGCEDADLCIKIKKEGYKIVTVLSSKMWHKSGRSRKRKFSNKLTNMFNTVNTELKFLYRNNRYFFLFLPFYIVQIMSNSISGILRS